MAATGFRALMLRKDGDRISHAFEQLPVDALPPGDVLVSVAYSTVNYKDGLALKGAPGVIRNYPMIPGIDLSGTVVESASSWFKPGDRVVATGAGLGEIHWGGYAEMARIQSDWLAPVPQEFTLRQAMGIGTAGFTAMLCVLALESRGLAPSGKEVVVTGAAGGVGSVAVAILSSLGYRVVAATRRDSEHQYLWRLGAAQIIDTSELAAPSQKPMETERWAGAVDTVGGEVLAGVIRALASGGSVAACGLAGGNQLNTTVFPFILRGVSLLGINSVSVSNAQRRLAWQRLARDLPAAAVDSMIEEVALEDVFRIGAEILKGRIRGRVVVKVRGEG